MREPVVPQLDAEQFVAWESSRDERFELHRGFVFAFAGGTADHDRLAFAVRSALEATIDATCRTFGSDMKVRVAIDTVYYPDVSVACGEIRGDVTLVDEPLLVVEVLSPSTERYDLVEKRAAYRANASLRAYVVVHTTRRRIEVDRRDPDGAWHTQTVDDGDVVLPYGSLALASIYARTSLASPS